MCLQRKRKNHFYELNTMKHNWEYKKLGEVCEILDSKRKPVTKKDRKVGQYPYYGAMGIQDYVDSFIFDGDYLLVGEDGAKWGANDKSAFQVHGKCWVNNHAHILKVNEDEICSSFIEHYLVGKDLSSYITGAVVPKLTQASLVSIPIPLPPLPIQQKIVAELDKVSLIIDKKKQQLKELDKLAQAIFYDMFGDPVENEKGWEVKKLGEVCPVIVDGVHQKPNYTDSGKPFVSVVNINSGYLNLKGCKYVSCDDFLQMTKKNKAERGDVLYSKVGATYGIPALVNTDDDFALYVSVCLMKPNRNLINSVFLKQMMATPFIKEQADNRIKGIGVPDLHLNQIRDFNIILPPLSLQQSFAAKIEAIEKQKELICRSIKEAQTLFDERMDYWFD